MTTNTETVTKTTSVVQEIPRFRVAMLNDDYTPMEFVVAVLCQIFAKPAEEAEQIMLDIHHNGRGICGVFSREIAEAKVAQVELAARRHEHPLLCLMEEDI